MESTTQGKTSRLLNTLEARLWRKNTVADRSSEEFCEALPDGNRASVRSAQGKNSVVSSRRTKITEDSEEICQVGIEKVQGVHRGQNC
jgi:hypothetical protein